MTAVDDVLTHFGKRGMKWGVRKSSSGGGSGPPTDVAVRAKNGKRITTKGGSGHPASGDAIRAAAARQKAKASGPHSLSNKEMQDAVTRMGLDQQFSKLSVKKKSAGQKFAGDILVGVAKTQVTKLVSDAASKQLGNMMSGR